MSDCEWDADNFEPEEPGVDKSATKVTDKWEGEDEEDDIKDNWDDDDKDKGAETGTEKAVQKKKKRPLKEILAEKEAQRIEEEKKLAEAKAEVAKQKTPAAIAEAKERIRRQQEEADLKLAKEAFGIEDETGDDSIDAANPESKEDFDQFSDSLKEKISQFEKSKHYVAFLDKLFSDLSLGLEPEDLKKLGGTLSALASEKMKQQKAVKAKKKKKGVTLQHSRGDGLDDYQAASYDGFDDFI